jgi:transposase
MEMDDDAAEPGSEAESAHTTSRVSARSQRIEVITRGERRRHWSVEQKREIATESLEPGISPITVARRYGHCQVSRDWRWDNGRARLTA